MVAANINTWLVEERGSDLIKYIGWASVAESLFKQIPMTTLTKSEPRLADMSVSIVPKSGTYPEDTSGVDEVLLTQRKFGSAYRLAEEDIIDQTVTDVLAAKKDSWGRSYAVAVDNATLGITGAENGTTVPFTSLYAALAAANSATSYTAGANIASGNTVNYGVLSNLIAKVEESGYMTNGVLIAHPRFKTVIRNLVDNNGRPLFLQGGIGNNPDNFDGSIFGYPVKYTNGAVLQATLPSGQPVVPGTLGVKGTAGNPFMAFVDPQYMLFGKGIGPESVVIPGRDGLSALTDEDILKIRARRAFKVGHEKAAAIFELTA